MEYTQLGRSGRTMNFSPETDPTESFAITDAARTAGINSVNTANVAW